MQSVFVVNRADPITQTSPTLSIRPLARRFVPSITPPPSIAGRSAVLDSAASAVKRYRAAPPQPRTGREGGFHPFLRRNRAEQSQKSGVGTILSVSHSLVVVAAVAAAATAQYQVAAWLPQLLAPTKPSPSLPSLSTSTTGRNPPGWVDFPALRRPHRQHRRHHLSGGSVS